MLRKFPNKFGRILNAVVLFPFYFSDRRHFYYSLRFFITFFLLASPWTQRRMRLIISFSWRKKWNIHFFKLTSSLLNSHMVRWLLSSCFRNNYNSHCTFNLYLSKIKYRIKTDYFFIYSVYTDFQVFSIFVLFRGVFSCQCNSPFH